MRSKSLENFNNKNDPILKEEFYTNLHNSLKTLASSVPTLLFLDNGNIITNHYYIPNIFNNHFVSVAETTQKADYLSNESSSTTFLQPTDKEERADIISSFNSKRAPGPNSVPCRISFLLTSEILKQLGNLFNLFFLTGVFTSVLKTLKVLPVFKKDSKLDNTNYRTTFCYQILKKYLKKLYIRDYISFSITTILFQFGLQFSIFYILCPN